MPSVPRKIATWRQSFSLQARLELLTEQEVARSWRKLFNGTEVTQDSLDKAERLLDELRYESPLRHRLGEELEELRNIAKSNMAEA